MHGHKTLFFKGLRKFARNGMANFTGFSDKSRESTSVDSITFAYQDVPSVNWVGSPLPAEE
jgi:hypothetical protein